jgi:anthranilate phosphoribosyltransferase
MLQLAELTTRLAAGHDLTAAEAELAAGVLTESVETDEAKVDFLAALARKGETPDELAAFARAFRGRAVNPGVERWAPRAIDIVGTGGDHAGGFNISSLVVLVLASAGVTVMKHGNRGVTSKCGSADLLAALGVALDAPPEKLRRALDVLGFAFFFAPAYHPAFKHIAPARKALAARGQRSVFNILGPMINPGRPAHVMLGVFAAPWVPKLALAMDALGENSGIAVHGILADDRGIDELTTATRNRVRGFGRWREIDGEWQAGDFGVPLSPFADLLGGDLARNRQLVDQVLAGQGPVGLVNTIALNAAVAMWIVGRTSSVAEGVAGARDLLLGGAVARKIRDTRDFFAE